MNELVIIDQTWLTQRGACQDGMQIFRQLFPNGATLTEAISGLDAAGHGFGCKEHDDWSYWLFDAYRKAYKDSALVQNGYRNTGSWNTGDWNTGDRNTGNWNTGDRNTGYRNTGDWNTGNWNTGHWNTGNWNTGHWNTGDRNTGDRNTGNWNTGDRNTGDRNTGNWNTGNWNTGDHNSGFFNIDEPSTVRVFGQDIDRSAWEAAYKPKFLYFDLTYWVSESEMTDEEKAADPNFYLRGGQLRKKDYKQAFKESWDKADPVNREKVRDLPEFDAEIFYQISGIDLR